MNLAWTPTLDFLAEPAVVVLRDGRIVSGNAAMRRLLLQEPAGVALHDVVADPAEEIDDLLRRASRSTSPTLAAIILKGAAGPATFRVHAARLPSHPDQGDARLVVHCMSADDDQFALLSRKVRHLDEQLRRRMQEKAALQEALRQNQTLLSELQHRVKNNIQLMMTLIRMSARGRNGPHIAELVETAQLRLQAMASTQEALYRSATAGTVRAKPFLEDLVRSIAESAGFLDALESEIEDVALSNDEAHCLALIVNELLTNAGKYGLPDGKGRIRVSFGPHDGGGCLVVEDSGPGIDMAAGTNFSGLGLVRGLCRQIGGRLEIVNKEGATCRVEFAGHQAQAGQP